MKKIHIIGIGYKPLDERSRKILSAADTILTSARLLEVFKGYEAFPAVKEKVRLINRVDETMEFMRHNRGKQAIVLLGSGDPMFFGIGRQVVAEFGEANVDVIPDLSSAQVAFSRIKETWDNAFLMSLHGGIDPERRRRLPYGIDEVPLLLLQHRKIAILTDSKNNPAEIARRMLDLPRFSSVKIFVCERLGYDDERITSGTPEEIANRTFSDPNVVVLVLKDGTEKGAWSTVFGVNESEITHSRGLITKDEVRAVTLHKLRLPQRGVLWDVGAGSGSVSIEAAGLCPGLKVYAVEKDEEQIANMEENKNRFGVTNMKIIRGAAPEALQALPSPDRAFVGGSGGQLSGIIGCIREKMAKGIVVVNAVTRETLDAAPLLLENSGFLVEISQVSVSRSRVLNGRRHMAALNDVFVITGVKR